MGCFSWLDAKPELNKKPIRITDQAFMLVPKEFRRKYGKSIETYSYDGYGHFCGYDVYEVIAEWNRKFLSEDMLRPEPPVEKFGGLWNYEKEALRKKGMSEEEIEKKDAEEQLEKYKSALAARKTTVDMMEAYKNGKRLSADDKREIGIAIACYDDQNAKLPYPIKITHDADAIYEDCEASLGDPDQGCF